MRQILSKKATSICLISLAAVAAYVGLRAIPITDCGFLHYEPVEITADGIEICTNDAVPYFLDLTRVRFPVNVVLEGPETLYAGEEAHFSLVLVTDGGRTLLPHELAVTHTELVHVLIVDESLDDYHHIHPEPEGPSGRWHFSFTPAHTGSYQLIAESVLVRTRRQFIAHTQFEVEGDQPRSTNLASERYSVEKDGLIFQLKPEQPPKARRDTRMSLSVHSTAGEPVTLQPIMGAYAHLVAFDEDGQGFAHLHPYYRGEDLDPIQPTLNFALNTRQPGAYRIWAQVKIADEERFIPFVYHFTR